MENQNAQKYNKTSISIGNNIQVITMPKCDVFH